MRPSYAPVPASRRPVPGPRERSAPSTEQPSLDTMAAMLPAGDLPFHAVRHRAGDAAEVVLRLGMSRDCLLSVALLTGDAGHWLTVISADRLLDLEAASRAVGDPLAIAGPEAVDEILGDVDPAALCPLITAPDVWQLVDRRVPNLVRTVCPAGSPERSMVIDPALLIELLHPVIANVSVALA